MTEIALSITTGQIVGIIAIPAIALVLYLTRDFWGSIIYWFTHHENPRQAAIERWSLQVSERANLDIDGNRDLYRPTLYNLVLQDKMNTESGDIVIYSTSDLETMEKALYTVKRDLEQSNVYEFYQKWIVNPDFSYFSLSNEQRQEYFKGGGK